MGMISSALDEMDREEIKWEEPRIGFKKLCGTEQERARLSNLINTIAGGSEIGKAILEQAAANGYTLSMAFMMDAAGSCNSEKKQIVLNPSCSQDMLVSSLVHEARHAEQAERATWTGARGAFTMKTDLMLSRAEEADAQAAAAAACYEIKVKTGNSGPLYSMYDTDPCIVSALTKAAEGKDAPVTDKMMQAAFKGWYRNDDMVIAYEECYQVAQMEYASRKKDFSQTPYNKILSSSQIVTAICVNPDGKSYFENEKNVLTDRRLSAINSETMKVCDRFFKKREELTGQPADKSYQSLKIRDGERSLKSVFYDLKRRFSSEYRKTSYRDKTNVLDLRVEGDSSDARRINHLVNDLCENGESRKKLTALKTAGFSIAFEESMRVGVVRDENKKFILLNPAMEDDGLKKALVLQSERVEARTAALNRLTALHRNKAR